MRAADGVVVAVVELRDAAAPEQLAEPEEAARLLGDLHREQRLSLGADVGALGHVPQAVEVDVRPAVERDERAFGALFAGDVFLDARHRQRAGRLGDRAVVLEDVLDGRADLVGADQHDFVHVFLREPEGLLSDPAHRDAVGEYADPVERDAPAGPERVVHARRVLGLDADDPDLRVERLHVRRDAGNEPASADRHEYRVERPGVLAQDLHADGALPGDDVGVVERVDERQPPLARYLDRLLVGVVEIVAVQHHLAAEVEHRLDLDVRRGLRHHDHGRNAAAARRQRHALGMVAGRGADHAAAGDGLGEVRDLVVGAAQLEREDRLQVLALEQDPVAEAP